MNRKRMSVSVLFLYFITLLTTAYITFIYVIQDPTTMPFMEEKLNLSEISFSLWKNLFYIHLFLGIGSLALGAIQFSRQGSNFGKLHKRLGMIYSVTIFLNVLVVPYLAIFAKGGLLSSMAFFLLDTLWLLTTWMAVWRITQNNRNSHREWMQRSYAMTLVFVTFRIVNVVVSLLIPEQVGIIYPFSIFASIAINQLVVELLIFNKKKKSPFQPRITA